jgi:hypothetical protein
MVVVSRLLSLTPQLMRWLLAVEAPSPRTHSGAAILEIVPEEDMTTATGPATTGDGDELEVVAGHPGL